MPISSTASGRISGSRVVQKSAAAGARAPANRWKRSGGPRGRAPSASIRSIRCRQDLLDHVCGSSRVSKPSASMASVGAAFLKLHAQAPGLRRPALASSKREVAILAEAGAAEASGQHARWRLTGMRRNKSFRPRRHFALFQRVFDEFRQPVFNGDARPQILAKPGRSVSTYSTNSTAR